MADPRFFTVTGPFKLADLASQAGASLAQTADGSRVIKDVAPLDQAGPDDITFLDNRRYLDAFAASRAGACVLLAEHAPRAPAGMALVLSETPYMAFAKIVRVFYPYPTPFEGGISAAAAIDPTAVIGAGSRVEAGAVIGHHARLGADCHIGATAVIGDGVTLGDNCRIGAGASISHSIIGNRVYIYPGARIGQEGFGFASGPAGHLRIPQLGRVIIHDDVEIGANSTIDRGAGPDTVIGAGCMIDNLVQIGHNVQMGRGCVIVSQVGISGSTKLGDFVVIGGQAGLAGHLNIGSGVRMAARSGVTHHIPPGIEVGGAPAVPVREWRRQIVNIARLGKGKGE